jgi:S-disulfanyl-L-cysteine oxidoreductase SoxD
MTTGIWAAAALAQAERSVWSGIFTDDQAARGESIFKASCSTCHAAEDFSNPSFLMGWEGMTVLNLFQKVQNSMPMDNPGSLRPEDYADVLSYFFRLSKAPAGKEELDTDPEHLKLIRIEPKK